MYHQVYIHTYLWLTFIYGRNLNESQAWVSVGVLVSRLVHGLKLSEVYSFDRLPTHLGMGCIKRVLSCLSVLPMYVVYHPMVI